MVKFDLKGGFDLLVRIEKLVYGGMGLGRVDGKATFVEGGVPGDFLEVTAFRDRKTFAETRIETIITASPERTSPRCNVFGKCGGCQWQHINYAFQLEAKGQVIAETLRRIGGFKELTVEPIVSSPDEYGYRDRVTLSAWLEDGKFKLGYHEKGESRGVAIDECPIASEKINAEIRSLNQFFQRNPFDALPFNRINIVSDGERAFVTFSLITGGRGVFADSGSLEEGPGPEERAQDPDSEGNGEPLFQFESLDLKFSSVPTMFMQANRKVNEHLVSTVIDWAALEGSENVLDLFCGVGNFSLHLAKRARNVVGVDGSQTGVSLARKNSRSNTLENVSFVCSPVASFLSEKLHQGARFELVVLDPPREGARNIIDGLLKLSPGKIIYVSCNPSTLARDLKRLTERDYKLVKIRPFDMFPQTFHIEAVALLLRLPS